MKEAVVYSSLTGNTKMLAETIRETRGEVLYCGAPDSAALEAERLYVGFWTDKGTCDEAAGAFLEKLRDQEVFLVGTAGFGGDPAYFDKVLGRAREHLDSSVRVIGTFMCQGKMPIQVREKFLTLQSQGVPDMDRRIANYDQALTHPDQADLEALKQAIS